MNNVLLSLREKQGKTQQQVADDLSMSRSHYTLIEGGKKKPSLDLAFRIAEYFGVPVDELFSNIKIGT